jgi:hypothetical protein
MTKLEADYLRTTAVWYLKRFIGLPYKWSGNDPLEGFDCSGLIHEVLQAVGLEQRGFDSTARDLYEAYEAMEVKKGYAGCLVFWWIWWQGEERVMHVEMMIDDKFSIGASGGVNFILLWVFYCAFAYGAMLFMRFASRLFFPFFGAGSPFLVFIMALFAGAYLSKWRRKQGGGWTFY